MGRDIRRQRSERERGREKLLYRMKIFGRSSKVKLLTDEKQRCEESEKKVRRKSQRREKKKMKINEEKVRDNQTQEDAGARKGSKVAKHR